MNVALGHSLEQAALNAGYSPNTARHQQSRLLATVGVSERVDHHKQQLHEAGSRTNVTPEWITQRLATLAQNDDNPAAAVSSLRTLADIMGMLQGGRAEMPPGLDNLLSAIGDGLRSSRPELAEPEAHEVEPRSIE